MKQNLGKRKDKIRKTNLVKKMRDKSILQKSMSTLKEGLNTPLNSDNKGFMILHRLGYKSGEGLGRRSEGLKDPLPIDLSRDHKFQNEPDQNQNEGHIESHVTQFNCNNDRIDDHNFVANARLSFRSRQELSKLNSRLRQCQLSCEDLDLRHNVTKPLEFYYWRASTQRDMNLINEDINESDLALDIQRI
ncbi:MAG: G patch domain-containing protein 11, variant 2 [Marteilia pararefringens]